jgi:hypothetical protein
VCCHQQNDNVYRILGNGEIELFFSRSFGFVEVREWNELNLLLRDVFLNEEEDMVQWPVEKNFKFSTKSLYMFILNPGVRDLRVLDLWKSPIPLKQIFCLALF